MNLFTFSSLTILLIVSIGQSFGHLSDIIKTDSEPVVGPTMKPDQMFNFITAGVSQIFWSFMASDENVSKLNFVASPCKKALMAVSAGLKDGQLTAYKFVDSSAKTPPGFIRRTMASFGDFDECLSINGEVESVKLTGKYCAFDLFTHRHKSHPRRNSSSNNFRGGSNITLYLDEVPLFQGIPFIHSICLPSQCSLIEIRQVLSTVLQPYGFRVTGAINCDTSDRVSLFNRLRSLNTHQIVAGLFIASMITLVLTSTAIHLYHSLIDSTSISPLVSSLSMLSATKNLFWAKPQTHEVIVFDSLKNLIIVGAAVTHSLLCVEIPLGFYLLETHDVIESVFSSPATQSTLIDAGLVGATVLTGIATAVIAYPLATRAKLSFIPAILDRFLRFAPAMAAVTALELLWPLIGNGPIFSRVSNFVLNKCTQNWWRNLFFINNYGIDTIDICAGSSFYSSVDMQLFIIGLIMIYLLAWRRNVAYVTCVLLILASFTHTSYKVIKYETTGLLFKSNPIPIKISEYLDFVHMSTTTYLPGYILGILTGYFMAEGKAIPIVNGIKGHIKWLMATYLPFISVTICVTLYNLYDLIPQSLTFIVVLYNRTGSAIGYTIGFIYLIALKPVFEFIYAKIGRPSNGHGSKVTFNPYKGFSRLTFPVYICHYLVIRTLFFTSRNTFPTDPLATITRVLSSLILIYIASFIFHILFLSPLDELRKWSTGSKLKVN